MTEFKGVSDLTLDFSEWPDAMKLDLIKTIIAGKSWVFNGEVMVEVEHPGEGM